MAAQLLMERLRSSAADESLRAAQAASETANEEEEEKKDKALTTRNQQLVSVESVAEAREYKCGCSSSCLLSTSVAQLGDLRRWFCSLNREEKSRQLMSFVRQSRGTDNHVRWHLGLSPASSSSESTADNRLPSICRNSFMRALGISDSKLRSVEQDVAAGLLEPRPHGNIGRSHAGQSARALAWLEEFYKRACDKPSAERWVLHDPLTQARLWEMMKADLLAAGVTKDHIPSLSTFNTVRRERFAHVVSPHKTNLPECPVCFDSREQLKKETDLYNREKVDASFLIVRSCVFIRLSNELELFCRCRSKWRPIVRST